jgi:hypothetical protein
MDGIEAETIEMKLFKPVEGVVYGKLPNDLATL